MPSMPNIHSTWLDLLRWGVKSTPSYQSRGLGSEENTYGERGGCLGKGAPKEIFIVIRWRKINNEQTSDTNLSSILLYTPPTSTSMWPSSINRKASCEQHVIPFRDVTKAGSEWR
ncbi:hypothetical protein CEXT_524401 [Caerostris extrusa]|uniref:Uncharacterized protein n=1 Tax=Caerostris extrusa TaxID=172846 RepID=A0AAV4XQJ5_CAEEX|nr:hypothetical protein CEXT_524401 [Caerostris extrusa]